MSVAVKLDIGGEEWYQCMDVARYGGKWYNLSFIGNIGNLLGLSIFTGGLAGPRNWCCGRTRKSGVPPVRGALFCLFRCLLLAFLL